MSIDIKLGGGKEILLSHMSLLGAASILDEALGAGSVLCRWTDEADAVAMLRVDAASEEQVGEILREHAARHAQGDIPWMHARHPVLQSHFATRAKAPASHEAWEEFLGQRVAVSDSLRGLESEMTLGLGERAWWLADSKTLRPDHGASPWEMRTRNKGMEVVVDALLPLARAVAGRDPKKILDGLTGSVLDDEPAKNKSDSRTSQGLGPIGPTDAARAWCGMWGIASFPIWHRPTDRSIAPAAVPRRRDSRAKLLMAVPTQWVTVPRWQAVLRSESLSILGRRDTASAEDRLKASAAHRGLVEHGFKLMLEFPVNVTGSTSAPERRAMEAVVLA